MPYEIVFEFPDADVFGVRASRIVSDPFDETVRIDVTSGQATLTEERLHELMNRLGVEIPSHVTVIGDHHGYELLQQARRQQMEVMVRFEAQAQDVFVPAQAFEV